MADQTDLLTASIDDYLISLGESLHKAQRQLSQMSTALQPGESAITYHVPRLEFEFKVSFELSRTSAGEGEAPGRQLRLRPASGGAQGSQAQSAEAASIIRGSFVAVPISGGKPPPMLRSRLTQRGARMLEVEVEVRSSAGERLSGVEVQFNIDPDQSEALTRAGAGQFSLAGGTGFVAGTVRTNAEGRAPNLLQIDPDQAVGVYLLLTFDILGATERVLYQVPRE